MVKYAPIDPLGFPLHKFESMSTYHNNDSCQKLLIVPVLENKNSKVGKNFADNFTRRINYVTHL
jgi:hypothetical protein